MKFAKFVSFFLLVIFCCSSYSYACSNGGCEGGVIKLARKLYIARDQIDFSKNKIFVLLDKFVYETPGVFSDINGYYVDQILIGDWAKSGDCSWYEWQCSRCGFCNLRGVDWECRSCNFPISQ